MAIVEWGGATLLGSGVLMLLVLAVRLPLRRWIGPRLAYALWAMPAARMLLPPLPSSGLAPPPWSDDLAGQASILFVGPTTAATAFDLPQVPGLGSAFLAVWLVGAVIVFGIYAVRHVHYCGRLRKEGLELGNIGRIAIIGTDIDGPLTFGIYRRFIAVPREFTHTYSLREQELALAHERAHHARGDLVANWVSLVVLAAHWWNPIAWIAIRAFREDQEMAADAHVLAGREPASRALYAHVLAKAAGIGALPACNLNARCNLKGRLMTIQHGPHSRSRLAIGGVVLALSAGAALAATASAPGAARASARQAVTIGVKPDGQGSYALILGTSAVASAAPQRDGLILPVDFDEAGGCDLKATAKPVAMVIKGMGATRTYTVMCASAPPAPVRTTLAEGLVSLQVMRTSVAAQPASSLFPETERAHALEAIDGSIAEVRATLASPR